MIILEADYIDLVQIGLVIGLDLVPEREIKKQEFK